MSKMSDSGLSNCTLMVEMMPWSSETDCYKQHLTSNCLAMRVTAKSVFHRLAGNRTEKQARVEFMLLVLLVLDRHSCSSSMALGRSSPTFLLWVPQVL
eukprot:2677431-Amphidinium_carterae.1